MTPAAARLLVATRFRAIVHSLLPTQVPGVRAVDLEGSGPADWTEVTAILLGSVSREAVGWDPTATPRLRFVQRVFTGVDDLPFDRIPLGVEIAGNVGGFAPFVAEHAVALALSAARTIVTAHAQVASGRLRPAPENRELWHRTAVILGYGEIGQAIAARLRPFEMTIVGVNRRGTPVPGAESMYSADRLIEALRLGDVVLDARPLTRSTVASISRTELEAMPTEGIYVNIGRAGTVDEEALYRHLVAHPPFRAALDVWWDEGFADGTLRYRFPFPALPNFIGTPHSAATAPPVEEYAVRCALQNLARFFAGERPRYLVDRSEYEGLPARPTGV